MCASFLVLLTYAYFLWNFLETSLMMTPTWSKRVGE